MTILTVALLGITVFTPSVFAQCVEQKELIVEIIRGTERDYQKVSVPSTVAPFVEQRDRLTEFSAWLEMVKGAERDYKNKNRRYGDLAALRKAHLLRSLVFESGSSEGSTSCTAEANFVPKSTLFQVTVSADGQHFGALIGDQCVSVNTDDMGVEWSTSCYASPLLHRDFQDSPEGLIFAR